MLRECMQIWGGGRCMTVILMHVWAETSKRARLGHLRWSCVFAIVNGNWKSMHDAYMLGNLDEAIFFYSP